jgi:RNA polymerase sigma factor (sigma-70 family)
MKTVDSQGLLTAYVRENSEAAFRELVDRYIDLVFSTALRLTDGDVAFAEDVAQTVFIDLAQKARGLACEVMLGGWLHRRTCHVAATLLRSERRRRTREREAAEMNTQQDNTQTNLARVTPILDEAINQLNREERAAIILRFFEQRDFRAVGEALHSSEDAARMRVNRALDKLHSHLSRGGVTLAAGALATGLAAEAAKAAPGGLAAKVAGTALAAATLGGGVSSAFFKALTLTKLKAGAVAVLAVAGIATLLVGQHLSQTHAAHTRLRQQNDQLREQLRRAQELAPQQGRPQMDAGDAERQRQAPAELLRLRGEVTRLRQQLQAAAAGSNLPAPADSEPVAAPNLVSNFTPLQASIRAQLTAGQTLAVGGWPGRSEARLLVLVVPRITGDNADQVAIDFHGVEVPETTLAQFGLAGVRTEGASSTASTVLPAGQFEAMKKTFDGMFQRLKNTEHTPTEGEASPDEHLNWLFLGSATATNGQPIAVNYVLAIYSNTWSGMRLTEKWAVGMPLRCATGDDQVLDLGSYAGPALSATPVILGDRNSIDLSLQATIFKRFDNAR